MCGAFGNSIEFTFECADNFSAGTQVEAVASGKIKGYFTQGTEYADYYGRMYYMEWALSDDYAPPDDNAAAALAYPKDERKANSFGRVFATTTSEIERLDRYRKDSREKTKMSYRIEAFAEDKSFIIGSGLGAWNLLVTNERQGVVNLETSTFENINPKIFVLSKPIGKFDDLLDTSGLITGHREGYDLPPYTLESGHLNCQGITSPISGKAWVIAYPYYNKSTIKVESEDGKVTDYTELGGGEILIGRNIDIKAGDTVGDFKAYAVHDLQAYITSRKMDGILK